MRRIGVMASGGGTNFQALIEGARAEIAILLVDRDEAYAAKRARKHGIPVAFIGAGHFENAGDRDEEILRLLREHEPDLIVLAGFLGILSPRIIRAYPGRIINIHPSLIPEYAGKGYYGRRVHEAVIANHEAFTGATVHYVDEGIDTGGIIAQERIPVADGDTPETLAQRVLEIEHRLLVDTVNQLLEG